MCHCQSTLGAVGHIQVTHLNREPGVGTLLRFQMFDRVTLSSLITRDLCETMITSPETAVLVPGNHALRCCMWRTAPRPIGIAQSSLCLSPNPLSPLQ